MSTTLNSVLVRDLDRSSSEIGLLARLGTGGTCPSKMWPLYSGRNLFSPSLDGFGMHLFEELPGCLGGEPDSFMERVPE